MNMNTREIFYIDEPLNHAPRWWFKRKYAHRSAKFYQIDNMHPSSPRKQR
jgi:hypothetical protein